jgi:DNA-binding SARP family transcriptional activator
MTAPEHRYLRLLGQFAAGVVGREPLPIRSQKGAALLAFLARQPGRRASREEIATLLWGDRHDRQARQSLRQCLVSLRTDLAPLGPGLLIFDGDQIALATEALTVDVDELARIADCERLSELERGLVVYRGPFLADCKLDLETFSNWLRAEREGIDRIAARAFERCADRYDAIGDGEKAIGAAARLAALDPPREDWQRRLLRLHMRYRGYKGAAAQARSLIKLLRNEFDADPEPATKALIAAIERTRVAARQNESIILHSRRAKPSLAVLSFAGLNIHEELAALADGIKEDLVAGLARNKSFFVMAADRPCRDADELKRIAGELGAEYVLVGSLRRANEYLRLTVRLIDAATQFHIWARDYTHEFPPCLADLQGIRSNIAASIEPLIYAAEENRLRESPSDALDAAGCITRALYIIRKRDRQSYAIAEELIRRAVEFDSGCARAYSLAAWLAGHQVLSGFKSRQAAAAIALDNAQKAIAADDRDARAHFAFGWALAQNRLPEEAIEEYRKAIEIDPYFAPAYNGLGLALAYVGSADKALITLANSERLAAPEIFPGFHNSARAGIYFCAERYRDAIAAARRSIREGGPIASRRQLVVNCALAGEMQEARAAFDTFARFVPHVSINRIAGALPNIRDGDRGRTLDAFHRLGVR